MGKDKQNFDGNELPRVCDRFTEDLKALFEFDNPVRPEVDRAILDKARQRLTRPSRGRKRLVRWAGAAGAAAAVIICIFVFNPQRGGDAVLSRRKIVSSQLKSRMETSVSSARRVVLAAADIDHNGRVNIIDAIKLARYIERTAQPETRYDINRDGIINRSDVDAVAFAAVRLDKGV